jgi:hypothetical protein
MPAKTLPNTAVIASLSICADPYEWLRVPPFERPFVALTRMEFRPDIAMARVRPSHSRNVSKMRRSVQTSASSSTGARPVSTSCQRRAAEPRMITAQIIMMTVQIEFT